MTKNHPLYRPPALAALLALAAPAFAQTGQHP